MTQETIEEAMIKDGYNESDYDKIWREGVQFGAKWMQKRMYSEEDMKIAWTNGNNYHRGSLIAASQFTFEKTIEQFKKK